ncbi:glycosyltransferase family 2 protein [[Candida] arabinofermentans NRRL YB-2248]|uniref:chitin synthase n=1 Tax=[Candida] arabinofermentans NRRL YB-2248 TaxID=983967 RepID=A0A1E4T3H4_9ASCO|nr:glycosyltransferase family 2 protein [[Candida] arabinofermentans NRRL YB-2248]
MSRDDNHFGETYGGSYELGGFPSSNQRPNNLRSRDDRADPWRDQDDDSENDDYYLPNYHTESHSPRRLSIPGKTSFEEPMGFPTGPTPMQTRHGMFPSNDASYFDSTLPHQTPERAVYADDNRRSFGSRDRLNDSPSPTRRFNYSQSSNKLHYSPSPTRNNNYDGYDRALGAVRLPTIDNSKYVDTNMFATESRPIPKIPKIDLEEELLSSNVFGGYEFEPDEDTKADAGFVPFPTISNSYYEINTPSEVYNPFEMNRYDEDNESREGLEKVPEESEYERALDDYYDEQPQSYRDDPTLKDTDEEENLIAARQVRMVNGNLVLDCPVSDVLLNKYTTPLTEKDREFLFMRFQACTCEPGDFSFRKFSLRQMFYSQPRVTELLIVITMFNESDVHLARTLKGVFKNIRYLYSLQNSSTWGRDAWQKVVVTIVSDGRKKINPKAKALLGALGVYQEGFAKNKVNNDKVVSHIYEYTTMVGISKVEGDHVKLTTENQIPIQMIFCLKENNQQKINSHAWAFEAFCPILNPRVVMLLDVGTEPQSKSLYRLWKSFKDPRVAGSCGEIKASLGYKGRLLLNPLVAAQNFEYKISNILDKPMESVFGFVTVLPGAFSAYRYQALLGAPLYKYLKGEDLKKSNDGGVFNANMYLAEDRILCFELVAKQGQQWLLKYVNTASAYTDVPEQLHDFISQRRRWLNGSFFAAIYSVFHFYKIWSTSHSLIRKIMLHIEFLYQFINLMVSWFSLGSYFLVFRILTVYLAESEADFAPGNVLSVFFLWLYMASLVTTFVLAFGNKPKGTKKFYLVIVTFFAILMCYMIFAAVYMAVKSVKEILEEHNGDFTVSLLFTESRFRDLVIATASTYALYFIGSFLFLEPYHMFTSFAQYMLLSPAYINVLNIYAFCNIHDISWGTKGEDANNDLGVARAGKNTQDGELEIVIPTTKLQIDNGYKKMMNELMIREVEVEERINHSEQDAFYFAFMRSMTVLLWMVSNFVIVALVTETGGLYQFTPSDTSSDSFLPSTRTSVFLTVILWIVAFMALFRFIGCVCYLCMRLVDWWRLRKYNDKSKYPV